MFAASPAFIPRNHLVQRAIEDGERGDFAFFIRLLARVEQPLAWDEADQDLALPAAPQERDIAGPFGGLTRDLPAP